MIKDKFKILTFILEKNKNFISLFEKTRKKIPIFKNLFEKKKVEFLDNLKKKEEVLLMSQKQERLLLMPSKKLQISGLMYINEKEKIYGLCEESPEFIQKFLIVKAMVIYIFFSDKYFKKDFLEKVEKSFSIDFRKLIFKDSHIKKYFENKEIPLKQHAVSCISQGKTFSLGSLQHTFPNVSFTGFGNKAPINLWIETYIANRCLKLNTLTNQGNVQIINPENTVFPNYEEDKLLNTNLFNPNESQNQVGQPFADVHLYNLISYPSSGIKIESYYKDVKAKYQGPFKGHLTLIPNINEKNGSSYMTDIIFLLQEKAKKIDDFSIKLEVTKLKDILEKIHSRFVINKSRIFLEDFNLALKQASFNFLFKKLKINFTIASDLEEMNYEDLIIFQQISDNMPEIFDKSFFDLKKLGFRDSIVNPKEFGENIEKTIKLLPPHLQQQCLTNFQKFLEL